MMQGHQIAYLDASEPEMQVCLLVLSTRWMHHSFKTRHSTPRARALAQMQLQAYQGVEHQPHLTLSALNALNACVVTSLIFLLAGEQLPS